MAENSLSPAFVKINYTSPWGSHVMTVPSVPIVAGAYAPTGYAFVLRGLEVPVAVDDAVTDYVNLLKKFWTSGTTFTDAVVFAQDSPTDVPHPVASFALNISGDSVDAGWAQAAQHTTTIRADDFTLFKIVMLDAPNGNFWSKLTVVPGSGSYHDLITYVGADASWLASRGGGKPQTFLQRASTLNEKLRRSYGMN